MRRLLVAVAVTVVVGAAARSPFVVRPKLTNLPEDQEGQSWCGRPWPPSPQGQGC
jgi:hypothetical protein